MLGNSVTVIIPVYGDQDYWIPKSRIALESACAQTISPNKVNVVYRDTLQECRNEGLQSTTEYLIFLDADDTLSPTYIEEMLKGDADIRVPAVHRHYHDGRIDTDQHWYTPKDLMTGNYIVVSAMMRTSLFKQLGGFHDYETLEDWDLWLRAQEAGATFQQIPNAILNVSKRPGSRNSNKSFNQILANAKQRREIR